MSIYEQLYIQCMTFVWKVILFNKKIFYSNVMPQKHRFNITTSLFLYRIIWTSLPIVSNLMASTACAFCLLEFHICESFPPFKFGSFCCSFWTRRHQFRIWNITWYIPCTLARDRLDRNDISIFEILETIKSRTEICFM